VKDLKTSWHLAKARHVLTSWPCGDQVETNGLDGFGLKTTIHAGLPVWTSKLGEREVQPNGGDGGHVIHHENCVKQSQRREGACPSNVLIKSCTVLPLSDN